MPSIIYDFDALREAANLLNGADLPMNTVQPMAVEARPVVIVDPADYSYMFTVPPENGEPVAISSDFDYGC
jgi:hypothetical protein